MVPRTQALTMPAQTRSPAGGPTMLLCGAEGRQGTPPRKHCLPRGRPCPRQGHPAPMIMVFASIPEPPPRLPPLTVHAALANLVYRSHHLGSLCILRILLIAVRIYVQHHLCARVAHRTHSSLSWLPLGKVAAGLPSQQCQALAPHTGRDSGAQRFSASAPSDRMVLFLVTPIVAATAEVYLRPLASSTEKSELQP